MTEDEDIYTWNCPYCGFYNCECCSECGKPHRDCEGCDCPECWVCKEKEENILKLLNNPTKISEETKEILKRYIDHQKGIRR